RQLISTGVDGLDAILDGGFPKNSLIILAGNPGTGKTNFSAKFLYRGCVDYGEKGVYVSLAESRDAFYENMEVLGYDFKTLERKGRFRFMDMLTVKEPAVHTILDMIIEEVGKIKAKRLVLDSYSALAQAFEDVIDARIVAHTILGKIVRRMGCTTILIEETPIGESKIGFGVEEFVADGVLRLSTNEMEGYRIRELELLKLRGVRIKEPKLFFTLEGGFKVFLPFKFKIPEKPQRFQPVPDTSDRYSTGSESLDEVLGGGLPKGSVTLLELDEKVSADMYRLIIHPAVTNFMVKGRNVFMIPSSWVDLLKIKRELNEFYGWMGEDWKRHARIILARRLKFIEDIAEVIHVKGEDWQEDIVKVLEEGKKLEAETGQPSLSILSLDILVNLYGEKNCWEVMNLTATEARNAEAAMLILAKAGFRHLVIKLSPMADIYLRLIRKHGCLLLYGVKPRTGLYIVEADTGKGFPIPKLTPML
ncbi:MAG: ATPase domain-containing protein, partial [Candidatus Bathyarchaeia archaeon]